MVPGGVSLLLSVISKIGDVENDNSSSSKPCVHQDHVYSEDNNLKVYNMMWYAIFNVLTINI